MGAFDESQHPRDARTKRFVDKDTRHGDKDLAGFDQSFLNPEAASPSNDDDRFHAVAVARRLARRATGGDLDDRHLTTLREANGVQLDALVDQHNPRLDVELAVNPNLSSDQLDRIVSRQHDDTVKRQVIASACSNTGLDEDWRARCAGWALPGGGMPSATQRVLRRRLLENPACGDVAGRLLTGGDAKDAADACANPGLDDTTLAYAALRVRNPRDLDLALTNPRCGAQTIDAALSNKTRDRLNVEHAYAHPNIRPSTLADWKTAVSYDHPEAMLGAASNPRLTPGMARALHAQDSLSVDRRLAANPATPSDVLDACMGRRSKDVDVALAHNPNLTPVQYEQLCARNQGDDDFRAALRDNPRLARYRGKGR